MFVIKTYFEIKPLLSLKYAVGAFYFYLMACFMLPCYSNGQVLQRPSADARSRTFSHVVELNLSRREYIILPSNSIEAIRKEILDAHFLQVVGTHQQIRDVDLSHFTIHQNPAEDEVTIRWNADMGRIVQKVVDFVNIYIDERRKGHTPAFFDRNASDGQHRPSIVDPDLEILLRKIPLLADSKLQLVAAVIRTNKAGTEGSRSHEMVYSNGVFQEFTRTNTLTKDEVSRHTAFRLVDGPIAWQYLVSTTEKSECTVIVQRLDAQEFDPKYKNIFESVSREIAQNVKTERTTRDDPNDPQFQLLMKKRLKLRGIDWSTPYELSFLYPIMVY